MLALHALAQQCAPAVHPTTMVAILRVESTFNRFAIGVVGTRLERQPTNQAEAVATAQALAAAGYNFSLGIGQVNRHNLPKYGLDYQRAFEPCANLRAASLILKDCYQRAKPNRPNDQDALRAALSCYYSGNFSAGFRRDRRSQPAYVQKVLDSADLDAAVQRAQSIRAMPVTKSKTNPWVSAGNVLRRTLVLPVHASATTTQNSAVEDSVMVYR